MLMIDNDIQPNIELYKYISNVIQQKQKIVYSFARATETGIVALLIAIGANV